MKDQRADAARRAADEKGRELRRLTAKALDSSLMASEKRTLDQQIIEAEADLSKLEADADKYEAIADQRIVFGGGGAVAAGSLYSESQYHPEAATSFFADMYAAKEGSPEARERLHRNQRETLEALQRRGDVTTADPGLSAFVPPLYLGDLWAELPRASRPLADAIGSRLLPGTGMTVTIPRLTTGSSVASQANQLDAVSETDVDGDTITAPVVTIAGQVDVSRQALERTFPGADAVIFHDLVAAYDAELDRQLLYGTGSSGLHRGLAHASGSPGSSAYTSGGPTGVLLVKQVAKGASTVAANRHLPADLVVMHPRRAAYLASEYDADAPVLPAGSAIGRAVGFSQGGGPASILGLPVVQDSNIITNQGAGTNEDEVWVIRAADMLLWESPLRQLRFQEVLSGTLEVRLQVFSYSAYICDRWPSSLFQIHGTGLVTPTWT
jgi:HK97 family phage major capsid protein